MSKILDWILFLETRRDPEDKVDLFRITTLIEPNRPYNAYSVMKGKNTNTLLNFHKGQILYRIENGKLPKTTEGYEMDPDEKFFYEYVIEWIVKTGSITLSDDEFAKNFHVEKINRKKNPETGKFESEITDEKITRAEANDLKNQTIQSDPIALRAKASFFGKAPGSMKNPPKPKISDKDKWYRQHKPREFKLQSENRQKLQDFFDKYYINFYKASDDFGDTEDQVVYWSGIYTELLDILNSGRWIWEISGQKQVITDKDNRDYNLGLKITPPEVARQLTEIEFDKRRRQLDKANKWDEYGRSEFLDNIKIRYNKDIEGREVEILSDGTIRIPVKNSSENHNRHRLTFLSKDGEQIKIYNIFKTKRRGGYYVNYIQRDREIIDSKSIQDILNFVDSDERQITLPKIGFTIKKELRLPYRTIPSEKKELRDFILKFYEICRRKKGLEPSEETPSTSSVNTSSENDVPSDETNS